MTAGFRNRRGLEWMGAPRLTRKLAGRAPNAANRLYGVWTGLRRMAIHAVDRRMSTEKSDLALRLRKLQSLEDQSERPQQRQRKHD